MRNRFFSLCIVILAFMTQVAKAQDLVPKGKLIYIEYTSRFQTGRIYEKYKAHQLSDGRVEVSVYDMYEKFDSLTVYGDRQPLDSIQRVVTRWIEWFHPKGKRAYDEHNKGRFFAVFDSGDTLLIDRLTWCWGMKDIESFMRDYCTYQKTQMPFEEIKGTIPNDVEWHDGLAFHQYAPRKGFTARRYKAAGRDILVFRNTKTGRVADVWIKTDKEKEYDDVLEARMAMLSGVYENATGQAVFGRINAAEKEYSGHPGNDIQFKCEYYYDHVDITDTITWGADRVQEVDVPAGAPPGWGGAGALTGPTTWTVKFTRNGLHVCELPTGRNAPTHPAFGKDFTLKKIRGPYRHCADPWAITTERPITKGQLSMLTITQLREMMAEFNKRHADGSKLSELEQLNKSLLQTVISQRGGK